MRAEAKQLGYLSLGFYLPPGQGERASQKEASKRVSRIQGYRFTQPVCSFAVSSEVQVSHTHEHLPHPERWVPGAKYHRPSQRLQRILWTRKHDVIGTETCMRMEVIWIEFDRVFECRICLIHPFLFIAHPAES